jgi:hypothetical protein
MKEYASLRKCTFNLRIILAISFSGAKFGPVVIAAFHFFELAEKAGEALLVRVVCRGAVAVILLVIEFVRETQDACRSVEALMIIVLFAFWVVGVAAHKCVRTMQTGKARVTVAEHIVDAGLIVHI